MVGALKPTQYLSAIFVVLTLATSPASARDWRWYPKRESPDANVLRPDLEGTRGNDGQSGASELDEMRQWLYRRDVQRRERGFVLPDTVEPFEPGAADMPPLTPPRHWMRPGPSPTVGGFDGTPPPGRVRDAVPSLRPGGLAPEGYGEGLETPGPEADEAVPERHARAGKHRRHGKSAYRSRHRSGSAAKSHRGSKRRRR